MIWFQNKIYKNKIDDINAAETSHRERILQGGSLLLWVKQGG